METTRRPRLSLAGFTDCLLCENDVHATHFECAHKAEVVALVLFNVLLSVGNLPGCMYSILIAYLWNSGLLANRDSHTSDLSQSVRAIAVSIQRSFVHIFLQVRQQQHVQHAVLVDLRRCS